MKAYMYMHYCTHPQTNTFPNSVITLKWWLPKSRLSILNVINSIPMDVWRYIFDWILVRYNLSNVSIDSRICGAVMALSHLFEAMTMG